MSDLVGNPEDRFSRVEAHMILKNNIMANKKFETLIQKLKETKRYK